MSEVPSFTVALVERYNELILTELVVAVFGGLIKFSMDSRCAVEENAEALTVTERGSSRRRVWTEMKDSFRFAPEDERHRCLLTIWLFVLCQPVGF